MWSFLVFEVNRSAILADSRSRDVLDSSVVSCVLRIGTFWVMTASKSLLECNVYAGQWMGSPLHPVMCTEVFTFAADATKNPHLAEQHLRQVVPSSQAQAPSSLESRASSTGATLQLAYPSHYTEPSARSTAKTSQYDPSTFRNVCKFGSDSFQAPLFAF